MSMTLYTCMYMHAIQFHDIVYITVGQVLPIVD